MTTGWGESGGVDRVHVAGGADAGFCGFGSRPLPPCANISLPGAKLGCPRPGSAPRDRGQRLSPVQIAAAGCGTREKGANRDHKRAGETSRGNGGRACEREGCGGHGNAGRTSQLLGLQEGKARHGFLARTGKGRRARACTCRKCCSRRWLKFTIWSLMRSCVWYSLHWNHQILHL